ncbi:MAG: YkgJ family cysteine cluster protein [Arenicellales bacterium]|nr:YkgJ family cysteine cluster protein [Arenicellales bacterium]
MKDLSTIKEDLPFQSPVEPVELAVDTEIQFHCHKGIQCFNTCCKNIDITLTPYDILRLKRRLDMSSSEFVAKFTIPFAMDHHNLPGLKLATKPGATECIFLHEEGCSIYEDRPAACRYYALGSMGVRRKGESAIEDIYFIVREEHCLGHFEQRRLTVGEYREEQGCAEYDENNQGWRDIILKKRSSGPTVGTPSQRSLQLFDMCSYDLDSFREFIQTEGFEQVFELTEEEKERLLDDDRELLQFAFRFLKQVLFGEKTITMKSGAKEARLERRNLRHEREDPASIA